MLAARKPYTTCSLAMSKYNIGISNKRTPAGLGPSLSSRATRGPTPTPPAQLQSGTTSPRCTQSKLGTPSKREHSIAPPKLARVNILTPSGHHFGQTPASAFFSDAMAEPMRAKAAVLKQA